MNVFTERVHINIAKRDGKTFRLECRAMRGTSNKSYLTSGGNEATADQLSQQRFIGFRDSLAESNAEQQLPGTTSRARLGAQ